MLCTIKPIYLSPLSLSLFHRRPVVDKSIHFFFSLLALSVSVGRSVRERQKFFSKAEKTNEATMSKRFVTAFSISIVRGERGKDMQTALKKKTKKWNKTRRKAPNPPLQTRPSHAPSEGPSSFLLFLFFPYTTTACATTTDQQGTRKTATRYSYTSTTRDRQG